MSTLEVRRKRSLASRQNAATVSPALAEPTSPESIEPVPSHTRLFRSACVTTVVTLLSQVLGVIWIGSQMGARVEIAFWYVIPVVRVHVGLFSEFVSIIRWSSILTAVVASLWVGFPLIRNTQSLQLQAGRVFGFLTIFLIGFLDWLRPVGEEAAMSTRFQFQLMCFGLVAFTAAGFIVSDRDRSRSKQPETAEPAAVEAPA